MEGLRFTKDEENWDSDPASFEPLSDDTTRYARFCCEVADKLESDFEKKTVAVFTIEGEEYTFLVDTKAAADAKAAREAAAEAEKAEKMAEVDPALASEIKEKIQGTFTWSTTGFAGSSMYKTTQNLTFDGDSVFIETTTTLLNTTMNNQGTYYIANAYLVCDFADGSRACIPYTYENGEIQISAEIEGSFYTV